MNYQGRKHGISSALSQHGLIEACLMHLFEFGIGQLSWVECKDGGNVWAPSYPKSSKMIMMSMSGLPLIPDLHCPIDTISLTSQPADMRFVQNFTLPDLQAKTFTPSISPNFNSFSDKNTKK